MKLALVLITLISASLAQAKAQEGYGVTAPIAKSSAKAIYRALNVEPVAGSQFEVWWNEKSVGGLVCRETHEQYPTSPATYSCDLDEQNENDEAIYAALQAKEVAINPGIVGKGAYEKTVGGLTCTRRGVVYPKAPIYYNCTLK